MLDKKNVVFIVLDSLRKDRLSVYNDDVDFTENIQGLAESSVVFERAVSQSIWTLPSHASMFTGDYPWEHGATHQKTYFGEENDTFIQDFKEEGYRTGIITSNAWLTPHKGMTRDFDYVENFLGKADNRFVARMSRTFSRLLDNRSQRVKKPVSRFIDSFFAYFSIDDACKTEETFEEAKSFIEDVEDEDFFLLLNIMEPHEPYNPPEEYCEAHGVKDIDSVPDRQKEMFTRDIDFEDLGRAYDASADYTDDIVGRLMDVLEENGLSEDTVVVLLSDHGQALGEDGVFGHQFSVVDALIDTVLIVKDPDREPERRGEQVELRKLHDLVPYYAGIAEEPDQVHPEYVRGGVEFPECFIGHIPEDEWEEYYRKFRYVKKGDRKMVKSWNEDEEERYTTYDRDTGQEIEEDDELNKEVDSIDVDVDVSEEEAERDEEVKKRLEDLGYMGG
ncbi:MAG: sulfatase [Candidatus Nanohaloarchaea archaeon]